MTTAEIGEPARGPRLRFGTSGIPRSSARPATDAGIFRAAELGLSCLEMAWGNGVRMNPGTADRIAAASRETGLALTAHAPYYVNLCGDAETIARSISRLVEAGTLAARCGAGSFCFHAGFRQGQDPHHARVRVWRALIGVTRALQERGVTIDVRPELTGRPSQMGSFEEILMWCEMIPGVRPCIDFSHHFARNQGVPNDRAAFVGMLDAIAERLGRDGLDRLHVHLGGIEFGPHGERRHRRLADSAFRYDEVLRALRDRAVGGWVVCETPAPEDDALQLQRTWESLS